jgi:tetratricopeptide (TPR) repeat protein
VSTEAYVQRAELLADLGRYDDAAEELAHAIAEHPDDAVALTLLARVMLAADRPKQALDPADRAVAAAPTSIEALAVRGFVLAELDRTGDAAATADELLRLGPNEPFAQISAAAILADVRNGQKALDAAWRGVQLAPELPMAHLVLGLVSKRLQLFDLAERAYREALRLDPELAAAQHDIGLIRFEQRRFAEGLGHLADAAAANPANLQVGASVGRGLYQIFWYGAAYALIAPILAAVGGGGAGMGWRLRALFLGALGLVLMAIFAGRLPGRVNQLVPSILRGDRRLRVALLGVVAAPVLLILYALVGTPWPLVLAILGGFVTLFAVLLGTRR